MSNQLCDVEILKILLQLIFICIGWFVVHLFSSKRDLDKTKRDLFIKEAESLNDSVDEIFTLARQYHSDSSRDASKESDIKMKLQDLSHRISLLNKTSLHSNLLDCASKLFVNFKRSITEKNFEDEHHLSLKEDSDQFQNIAGYAIDLKHMILNFKHSQLNSF